MKMSKRNFSEVEQQILIENPNVKKISRKAITYSPDFKVYAVNENLNGKTPIMIFEEAGFNLEMIGRDKPSECLKRWRKTYKSFGEEELLRETRGKDATGRPRSSNMTDTEKLKRAEAKIKYLEAELDFIKKLDALERQVKKKK